jgi:hypothetical protein
MFNVFDYSKTHMNPLLSFKHYQWIFFLTLLTCSFSSSGIDLPWGQKKYTKDSCHAFIPRTEQQKNFIWNLCESWFNVKVIEPDNFTRNVCMRQNMEKAKNNEESKEVIINCFKKIPSPDNSHVLNIFKIWFPTNDEQQDAKPNRRLSIPQSTQCSVSGNNISCIQFPN